MRRRSQQNAGWHRNRKSLSAASSQHMSGIPGNEKSETEILHSTFETGLFVHLLKSQQNRRLASLNVRPRLRAVAFLSFISHAGGDRRASVWRPQRRPVEEVAHPGASSVSVSCAGMTATFKAPRTGRGRSTRAPSSTAGTWAASSFSRVAAVRCARWVVRVPGDGSLCSLRDSSSRRLESPAICCSRALTVAARELMSPGSTLGARLSSAASIALISAVQGSSEARAPTSSGPPIAGSALAHSGKTRRYNSQYRSLGLRAPRSHAFIMCIRPRRVASRLVGSSDELTGKPRDVPPAIQPPPAQRRTINLPDQRGKRKAGAEHSRHSDRCRHKSTLGFRPGRVKRTPETRWIPWTTGRSTGQPT